MQIDPKPRFEAMVSGFLEDIQKNRVTNPELEFRFSSTATSASKSSGKATSLTKTDYDNVVKVLLNAGFTCDNKKGSHVLRVIPTVIDGRKVRVDINEIELIEKYCRERENLGALLQSMSQKQISQQSILFTSKTTVTENVDFDDFGFRVSYQSESHTLPDHTLNQNLIQKWDQTNKYFRYLNRVQFSHPDLPVVMDLSIVRSSPKIQGTHEKLTLHDAKLFRQQVTYEIEMEVREDRAKDLSKVQLLKVLRQQIRIVLSALQATSYPIGITEKKSILQQYMIMVKSSATSVVTNKDFIGPSSVTLQQHHLTPSDPMSICTDFCVTEKADGQRCLLYVGENNRIYMIDMNMNVIFTGMELGKSDEKKNFQRTLLDGEFIKYNRGGQVIQLYAAFDIYYLRNEYVGKWFFKDEGYDMPEIKGRKFFRLPLLQEFIANLNANIGLLVANTPACPVFRIQCKSFESDTNIFKSCKKVIETPFEYNTDGLILTLMNASVGCDRNQFKEAPIMMKTTWQYSYKWKPPQFNTIDFLVTVDRTEDVEPSSPITYIEGENVAQAFSSSIKYKRLTLNCGYNYKDYWFLTKSPFLVMIEGELPPDQQNNYIPMPFLPKDPYNENAKYCRMKCVGDDDEMYTEETNEVFTENMIVEFRYEMSTSQWIPLRVRYDKMADERSYGNDFKVANDNWRAIHYPVTDEMIKTGKEVPKNDELKEDLEVYYNKLGNTDSVTKRLRNFHNVFVKKRLIAGAAAMYPESRTLLDLAVGKGGDLSKWFDAKLTFVLGIDISRDNIENRHDGAIARYVHMRMEKRREGKEKEMFKALFAVGNSGRNIHNSDAFQDTMTEEKEKELEQDKKNPLISKYSEIVKAVFGKGQRDEKHLGKAVYAAYNIVGSTGFNIVSCQFAVHYFFESEQTVHAFLKNVYESTALGGTFIGTCYDGVSVFEKLSKFDIGEEYQIDINQRALVNIKKQYDHTGFRGDSFSCLGYAIDVLQETINQRIREYLVHFDYLNAQMALYGFELITDQEAEKIRLPHGTGMFHELYDMMNRESKDKRQNQYMQMTEKEKELSFLNRYFAFKKVRNVPLPKIAFHESIVPRVERMKSVNELSPPEVPLPKERRTNIVETGSKVVIGIRKKKT